MTIQHVGAFRPAAVSAFPKSLLWLFGTACGLLIANVYYAQPLTGLIAAALRMPRESAGLIVTLPLVGYGLGLLLIVPLGDLVENRRLILSLIGLEAAALLLVSLASTSTAFLAAALLIGLTASGVQVILPYVSHLVPEAARGQALGRLVSGIMLGIMLARPVSSLVADLWSWRTMFQISAVAMAVLLVAIRVVAPQRRPGAAPSYAALIGSMGGIFREHEILRRRALYHAAMFGAFSVFWTAAPLWLSGAPFHLSQRAIALVALAGVAGAAAPPFAGLAADKGLARPATFAAMALAMVSFLLANLARGGSPLGLGLVVATAVLLDFAVSANMVLGQRAIYALGAEQRSRINALFMATFFAGGALASALSGWVFARYGWVGVSVLGAALPAVALIYAATERRRT
jgi:predicted MFS family arabinose efflux permease